MIIEFFFSNRNFSVCRHIAPKIIEEIFTCISIPIISSGGAGNKMDVADVILNSFTDAVSIASLFHYNIESIETLKNFLNEDKNISTRL